MYKAQFLFTVIISVDYVLFKLILLLFNANGLGTSYNNVIKALSTYKLHHNSSNINDRQINKYIYEKRERYRKNRRLEGGG